MVLERRAARHYPAGEYRSTAIYGNEGIGAGRAFGGVVGCFASLGIGLMILAFIAGFGVEGATDGAAADAQDVGAGTLALLVGALPILAALPLAVGAGGWAGYSTRSGGQGFLSGALGCVVGTLLMFALVAIGFALGAAAAGVTAADLQVTTGIDPSFASLVAYFASLGGLVYLLVVAIVGGLAGAFIGGMVPKHVTHVQDETVRRPVA